MLTENDQTDYCETGSNRGKAYYCNTGSDHSVPVHVCPHAEIRNANVVVQIPHPKPQSKITYREGNVKRVPRRMTNTLVIEIPGFDNNPLEWAEEGALERRGRRRSGVTAAP
mgnify:CR=1 FL=1